MDVGDRSAGATHAAAGTPQLVVNNMRTNMNSIDMRLNILFPFDSLIGGILMGFVSTASLNRGTIPMNSLPQRTGPLSGRLPPYSPSELA